MQLLLLRYYQLRRDLSYWVIIIAGAVFYGCLQITSSDPRHSWYLSAAVILFYYQYHRGRKDLMFIRTYFHKGKTQIAFSYNVSILPATLAMSANGGYLPALSVHTLISLLPWASLSIRGPRLIFIGRIIPPVQFEWVSGLRKNFYAVLALVVLAVLLSPVKLFGVAALFLLNLTLMGFYNHFEPRIMLNPRALSLSGFLRSKTNYLLSSVLLFNLPLLIVNSLFHQEVLWINLGFLAGFLLLAATTINIKYSNYQPGGSMPLNGDMLILLASVFIPYLLPAGIWIYFSSLKKSKTNLKQYTDDDYS